ncbi:hypothetical protein EZV62_008309 [Acer yangbiense]|uniref:CCHC-type domain-containing protein n=1 Tax=Acer yangbiense TaxID=1000413 RepID=A0A5C7ID56_9ROSI|nr:hypothetical protein EZV62_008309 [Acer yangbiense]
MSAAELAGLYENLSLAEEDGVMLEIAEEAQLEGVEGVEDVDRSLVGRTARWLAEQIDVVIEIPSKSRECWDKFIRVKVQIDISKPLKRWLRLKLGKAEEIVVIGLKYERLPDFCYACGRIGHDIKECIDEEAKKGALDGSPTKYGQWVKALGLERLMLRFPRQTSGSSFERDRSLEMDPVKSRGDLTISDRGPWHHKTGNRQVRRD